MGPFREFFCKCPQHGYELSSQIHICYNGLNYSTRDLVDAAYGGSITSKIAREASQLFEELAKKNYQTPSDKASIGRRKGGILDMARFSSLEAKFEALMTKLNQSSREPTLGEIEYM